MTDQNVHPDADRWGGWSWADPVRGEHFRRCSFCGSINPEDLVAESSWRADWADPKYGWPHKFYIDLPNRHPERLYVVSSVSGGGSPTPPAGEDYIAWGDLTADQRAICERDGYREDSDRWRPAFVAFGTRAAHYAKFYTIHLSDTDLAPATKSAIEQRSGLAFRFAPGHVAWYAAGSPPQHAV